MELSCLNHINVHFWLLQIPLLSLLCLFVCKYNFCKKLLSYFNVILGVYWYYGLAVRNTKLPLKHLVPMKFNKIQHFGPIHQLSTAKHIWKIFQKHLCNYLWWIFWPDNLHCQTKSVGNMFGAVLSSHLNACCFEQSPDSITGYTCWFTNNNGDWSNLITFWLVKSLLAIH